MRRWCFFLSVSKGPSMQQIRRHIKAEDLCGFPVDDKFVFRGCLHWQLGRFFALEDAIDIGGGACVICDRIKPA